MKDPFNARDLARSAAIENAKDAKVASGEVVGNFVSVETDEDHVATYLFEAALPGYLGWRWAVTVTKVAGDKPTICDVVLLPGPESLLAPTWVPYRDRIQPGDVGVGDVVPTAIDDERLVPTAMEIPSDEELAETHLSELYEYGLGRTRVLSIVGRDQASKRWYTGDRGPNTPIAEQAPLPCSSCGFFLTIAGSLRQAFGVCANAISPEDGRVVSVDHGCGAHSEALVSE